MIDLIQKANRNQIMKRVRQKYMFEYRHHPDKDSLVKAALIACGWMFNELRKDKVTIVESVVFK